MWCWRKQFNQIGLKRARPLFLIFPRRAISILHVVIEEKILVLKKKNLSKAPRPSRRASWPWCIISTRHGWGILKSSLRIALCHRSWDKLRHWEAKTQDSRRATPPWGWWWWWWWKATWLGLIPSRLNLSAAQAPARFQVTLQTTRIQKTCMHLNIV